MSSNTPSFSLPASVRYSPSWLAGKLSKEIAAALAISTGTVETHRARIMLKLDLHSVSDLVRYAVRNNFIRF
jgi:DNA-binding CsgD family transcriptional regulator